MVELDCLGERGQALGARLFADVIFDVHELEDFARCAEGLLKVVVEEGKFAHRVVEAKTAAKNATKSPRVIWLWAILSRPSSNSKASAIAPKISISGELIAAAATERRLARNRRLRGAAKSRDFPRLPAEGLHDAVAGDGLVQNILHVGQLILSAPSGGAHATPNADGG